MPDLSPDGKLDSVSADTTAKTTQSSKKAKKEEKKFTAVVVSLIVGFIAIAGIAGFFLYDRTSSQQSESYVSYPTVSTQVASANGEQHYIDVDFTIEYKDGEKPSASVDEIHSKLMETVSNTSYDEIKGADGVETLEAAVKEELASIVGEDSMSEVYIGNFVVDWPGTLELDDGAGNSNIKKLFKNVE